jgi:hypothetical protein
LLLLVAAERSAGGMKPGEMWEAQEPRGYGKADIAAALLRLLTLDDEAKRHLHGAFHITYGRWPKGSERGTLRGECEHYRDHELPAAERTLRDYRKQGLVTAAKSELRVPPACRGAARLRFEIAIAEARGQVIRGSLSEALADARVGMPVTP